MRPPPPLTLSCAPSRAWSVVCCGLGGLSGLVAAAWAASHQEWALPVFLGAAGVCALGGALLGWRIAGSPREVVLRWDGSGWEVDGVRGRLQVMLDAGRWLLLLRHQPPRRGGARWIAISFAQGADVRRALRTALYSRPPETSPDLPPHVRAPDRATD